MKGIRLNLPGLRTVFYPLNKTEIPFIFSESVGDFYAIVHKDANHSPMKNLSSSVNLLLFAFLGMGSKSCDLTPQDDVDVSLFVSPCPEEMELPSAPISTSEFLYVF